MTTRASSRAQTARCVLLVPGLLCGVLWNGSATLAEQESSTKASPKSATEFNNLGVTEARAGRFEQGAAWLRRALDANPRDPTTRKNLSGVLTDWATRLSQQGQSDRAMIVLQEATQHDPDNGLAWIALGDLWDLQRHDLTAAVAAWTQAHGKVPAAEWNTIASRIAQAKRDQLIERSFATSTTAHFALHVQGSATDPRLPILHHTLEEAYTRLAATFHDAPPHLTVLVYADEDFKRVSLNRDWMLGFYDGRIRLRWNEVDTPLLPWLIAHEVGHAFLQHQYDNRVPVWVHEGYAQFCEGPHARTEAEQRLEALVRARTRWVPLKWLDQRFTHPADREDIAAAYVEARLVIETLITRYGADSMAQFLTQLAAGTTIDVAYDHAFAPARWVNTDRGIFE